jgi:hypothetical protein
MGGLRSRVIGGFAVPFLATVLLVSTVAAKDCMGETPLPADVKLTPPGPGVPPDLARFAGTWSGTWDGDICTALVIEDVFANGVARVVYSRGTAEALKVYQPRYWRATARIAGGVLRFKLPTVDRPDFEYRLQSETTTLAGTFRPGAVDRKVSMTRVPDVATIGCASRTNRSTTAPAASRDRLTATDLLTSKGRGTLVHNDYFMPIGRVGPARHSLRGTIAVSAGTVASAYRECNGLSVPAPAFTVGVLTHGEHLVPIVRGFLPPSRLVVVSPGRVWSEPVDQGMSRASFPFMVVDSSGAHNGLATFVFDDTRVSNLWIQITQETAEWARNDLWGALPMTYTAGAIADEAVVRRDFDVERGRQVPIKPWSALPASARAALDAFDGEVATEDVSASGLVLDGTMYVRGCNTRTGPFPYCREMRNAAFSVTKSVGAAVALLRLAQKYGDDVFDQKIANFLAVTATHDGWKDVTFADALNMATGIGERSPQRQPNDFSADENRPRMFEWFRKRTLKDKLDVAFSYPKYPWSRGEVFRYNTTHTFVLAAAMDAFLKRRAGPNAHLWDMVVDEVYRPIGIFHAPMLHTIETDGGRGVPILGFGLSPTIDDVAKLAMLFQNGGRHDGRQLLPAKRIAEALYRASDTAGLPLGPTTQFGSPRYHLSFWSIPYRTRTGCVFQIPYMSGYGGNIVTLLPNGVSAFRFADAMSYDHESLVRAAEAIRPFCTPPVNAVSALPRTPLTAAEVRAELTGNTFYGGPNHTFFDASGLIYAGSPDFVDVGRWTINSEGQYCRTWNVTDSARTRCFRVYRDGEAFELHPVDRWSVATLKRARGNPERY